MSALTDRGHRCEREGWLVPPGVVRRDAAWREGEPVHGCGALRCGRCDRVVLAFEGALLRERPEDWIGAYEAGALPAFLMGDPSYTQYLCGCRAFAAGRERHVDELQLDDDLPWYCGGHPTQVPPGPRTGTLRG